MPTEDEASKKGRLAFRAIKPGMKHADFKNVDDCGDITGVIIIGFEGHKGIHLWAIGEVNFVAGAKALMQKSLEYREVVMKRGGPAG